MSNLEPSVARYFDACEKGDVDALRTLLANDPRLVHERHEKYGATGLHAAATHGHVDAVRLLLQHGADPNARDIGDNALPLHFAAANHHLETVRALLEGGSDVHGHGDLHKGDVIGWASGTGNEAVIDLLIERGARHHIFSAMALNDRDLVKKLVEADPESLSRRRSRFENEQTPLHMAVAPPDGLGGEPNYAMLNLLIELGADVEAKDDQGRTPMSIAMLRGDREAMRALRAAGAKEPEHRDASNVTAEMAKLGDSVKAISAMLPVVDVAASLEWYASIGFKEEARYGDGGAVNFGEVSFGKAYVMFTMAERKASHTSRGVSLWFYTDQVEALYQLLKARQLAAAEAALAGRPSEQQTIQFDRDLHRPFYGGREFGIRDPDGYELNFRQND